MRKEQLAEDLEREKEKLRLQLESANVLPVDDDTGHERTASEAYVPVKCADMEGSSDMQLRNASVMLLESVLDEVETSEDEPRAQRADRSVVLRGTSCVSRMVFRVIPLLLLLVLSRKPLIC